MLYALILYQEYRNVKDMRTKTLKHVSSIALYFTKRKPSKKS